jgi:hypothetical protein
VRILDRLLAGEPYAYFNMVGLPPDEALHAAQPVLIDNVAEYVFRNVKVGDSWDLRTDFPNVAPPFEIAWFEYRRPPFIASLRQDHDAWPLDDTPGLPDHIGVLVEGRRRADGWTSTYWIWSQSAKEQMRGPIAFEFDCDAEGLLEADATSVRVRLDVSLPDPAVQMLWGIADFLVPVLMATSLLHAKNVSIEREPPIDAPLQRAHAKRYGRPRVRFHVLHIDPMRKVLRAAGAETPDTGVRQAMHLVRGHFLDYRDGRGLFGRFRGLYWWDQHVAGRLDEGFVAKEYVVHGPDEKGRK